MSGRNFCFTINKTDGVELKIDTKNGKWEFVKYCVWQYEIGEKNGLEHIQGYIEMSKVIRWAGLRKILGSKTVHIEKRLGTSLQARNYCMKDATRKNKTVPFEYGVWVPKRRGERSDLITLKQDIFERKCSILYIMRNHTELWLKYSNSIKLMVGEARLQSVVAVERFVDVEIHYGQSGAGKSYHVSHKYKDKVYRLDIDCGILWFDGYKGEKILLIDEFEGNIKYSNFKKILDKYKYRCQIKGGYVWAEWEKVYIISNSKPNKWYKKNLAALKRRVNKIYRYDFVTQVKNEPWKYKIVEETWQEMVLNDFKLKM